jgi:hypothetical protein
MRSSLRWLLEIKSKKSKSNKTKGYSGIFDTFKNLPFLFFLLFTHISLKFPLLLKIILRPSQGLYGFSKPGIFLWY